MTILITGGSGFIGSHLDGDLKVSSKDANLLSIAETRALFESTSPTELIHAAAKHGNYAQIEQDKVGFYRENVQININVFDAAYTTGVRNIIAMSSVTAFPDNLSIFREGDVNQGEPHSSCYPYAYAKRMIEILCRAYSEQYGMNYNCVFLANAYGENGRDNVIPTLIQKCIRADREGTDLVVLGDGTPRRDFIYVDDVRRIINKLRKISNFGPLILSSGTSVSIKEVVDEIIEALQFSGRVVWEKTESIGQQDKVPSNQKLISLLPDFEFTTLKDGIKNTVNWFLHSQD